MLLSHVRETCAQSRLQVLFVRNARLLLATLEDHRFFRRRVGHLAPVGGAGCLHMAAHIVRFSGVLLEATAADRCLFRGRVCRGWVYCVSHGGCVDAISRIFSVKNGEVDSPFARADRTWIVDFVPWPSIWPSCSVLRCRLRSTRSGLSGR